MERIVIILYYTIFCILSISLTPARKNSQIITHATVDTQGLGTFEHRITFSNITPTFFLKKMKNPTPIYSRHSPRAFLYLHMGKNRGRLSLAPFLIWKRAI